MKYYLKGFHESLSSLNRLEWEKCGDMASCWFSYIFTRLSSSCAFSRGYQGHGKDAGWGWGERPWCCQERRGATGSPQTRRGGEESQVCQDGGWKRSYETGDSRQGRDLAFRMHWVTYSAQQRTAVFSWFVTSPLNTQVEARWLLWHNELSILCAVPGSLYLIKHTFHNEKHWNIEIESEGVRWKLFFSSSVKCPHYSKCYRLLYVLSKLAFAVYGECHHSLCFWEIKSILLWRLYLCWWLKWHQSTQLFIFGCHYSQETQLEREVQLPEEVNHWEPISSTEFNCWFLECHHLVWKENK